MEKLSILAINAEHVISGLDVRIANSGHTVIRLNQVNVFESDDQLLIENVLTALSNIEKQHVVRVIIENQQLLQPDPVMQARIKELEEQLENAKLRGELKDPCKSCEKNERAMYKSVCDQCFIKQLADENKDLRNALKTANYSNEKLNNQLSKSSIHIIEPAPRMFTAQEWANANVEPDLRNNRDMIVDMLMHKPMIELIKFDNELANLVIKEIK